MKLESQKEERYVNCASAEGKAIKRHPFQMSNAWEKVVGSRSLLRLLLAKPTFLLDVCAKPPCWSDCETRHDSVYQHVTWFQVAVLLFLR